MDRRIFLRTVAGAAGGATLAARPIPVISNDSGVDGSGAGPCNAVEGEGAANEVPPVGLLPDVVIVAASALGVSIAYDSGTCLAPKIVDRFEGHFVDAIVASAKSGGVYVWEDAELAEKLFRTGIVGGQIRQEHYWAVACVFACVHGPHEKILYGECWPCTWFLDCLTKEALSKHCAFRRPMSAPVDAADVLAAKKCRFCNGA